MNTSNTNATKELVKPSEISFICLTGITTGDMLELIAGVMQQYSGTSFTKETTEVPLEGMCDVYRFTHSFNVASVLKYKGMTEPIKLPAFTDTLVLPQNAGDIVLAGFSKKSYDRLARGLLLVYNVVIDETGCLIPNPKKYEADVIALNEINEGKMDALMSLAANSGVHITEINFKCFNALSTSVAYVFSQDIDVGAFISHHSMPEPLSVDFLTNILVMAPGDYDNVFALFTLEEYANIRKELKDKHNLTLAYSGGLMQLTPVH